MDWQLRRVIMFKTAEEKDVTEYLSGASGSPLRQSTSKENDFHRNAKTSMRCRILITNYQYPKRTVEFCSSAVSRLHNTFSQSLQVKTKSLSGRFSSRGKGAVSNLEHTPRRRAKFITRTSDSNRIHSVNHNQPL